VPDELNVILGALQDEAGKWNDLAERLAPIASAANSLTLGPTAFFIGTADFLLHSAAYNEFQTRMADVLHEGVLEFSQLATSLNRAAAEYDRADSIVELDLEKIYRA
jgi:hypothetical protein